MIGKCFSWAAILAIGLQVAGCYTDYGPVAATPEPILRSAVATRLQAGDKLKVIVYGEEALSGLYEINPSGAIAMPLIGMVRAAGRTRSEIEQEIAHKYSSGNYLQEPKVTVDVFEYRPIYVLGEALRPGAYPYKSGLNVLTAVTRSGRIYLSGKQELGFHSARRRRRLAGISFVSVRSDRAGRSH